MTILIDSKPYKTDDFCFIDTVNDTTCDEFIYYSETLYTVTGGEYILETSWQINPEWFSDEIKNGKITKENLLPQKDYQIIPKEEAESWLDMAIWIV